MRLLLIDDHTLFLEGLKLILKEKFPSVKILSFNSIKTIKEQNLDYSLFNLIICDLEIPNENIFEFIADIKKDYKIPILVISMHKKLALIKECQKNHIEGYLLKNNHTMLFDAINALLVGEKYYCKELTSVIKKAKDSEVLLSMREEEVIKLICKGYSNQEIASKLFISIETIKTHKKNIKTKLGIETMREIYEYAKSNFII
jgi:two-component system, NarL family, response regulator DesR